MIKDPKKEKQNVPEGVLKKAYFIKSAVNKTEGFQIKTS